jgi:hypothetical protein
MVAHGLQRGRNALDAAAGARNPERIEDPEDGKMLRVPSVRAKIDNVERSSRLYRTEEART